MRAGAERVRVVALAAAVGTGLLAGPAPAADGELRFLAGAATGLLAHETGHVLAGAALGAHPGLKGIETGGIPFFAVTHDGDLPPREEWTISSAGLHVDHGLGEWILTRHPRLREERAPIAKGVLAFQAGTSLLYAGAAFARAGPPERDTRGMALSLGVAEPWVGAMLLVPAALDGYRYYRPQARWARWASRAAKVGLVLLVLKADGPEPRPGRLPAGRPPG